METACQGLHPAPGHYGYTVMIIIKYNNHTVLYGALQYNNNNKSTKKLKLYNNQLNNLKLNNK